MALNHFRASQFKAKHFVSLRGIISSVIAAVGKLPFWLLAARGRGKVINTGEKLYFKRR